MPKPMLLSIDQQQIQRGIPAPFPVLDAHGTLLLAEGEEVSSAQQLEALQQIGLFRAQDWPQKRADAHDAAASSAQDADKVQVVRSFSQLRLQPGAVLHLRRSDLPGQAFVALELLGWLPLQDILVSALTHAGQELSLPLGTPLEVKLLAGKGVVSFESRVNEACQSPYPYWHLNYPQELVIRQLRKSLRASVHIAVRVESDGAQILDDCMIVNLSAYGGLLEVPLLFAQLGDVLQLKFVLSVLEQDHVLSVQAVVRNLHTAAGTMPTVQYGLEFLHVASAERLLIEHYIFQCLLNA